MARVLYLFLSKLSPKFCSKLTKIGYFQTSESIFEAKYLFDLPENYLLSKCKIRRTVFINNIFNFKNAQKTLSNNMCPNVDGPDLKSLKGYKKSPVLIGT